MKTFKRVVLTLAMIGCWKAPAQTRNNETLQKTIHVFVALCDNDSQGIVPVPKTLGNGDDPKNNLYWGAMYGTKTFLKQSDAWEFIAKVDRVNEKILERIILKHRATGAYLVADAYRGTQIRQAIESFLESTAGNLPRILMLDKTELGIYGNANLVAYIGHNGLMDFSVACPKPNPTRRHSSTAIILACKSKPYFLPLLQKTECQPLLLTTGFMAPEAYTLEAALEAWLAGEGSANVRNRAAEAYNQYQKCGIKGATRLFFAEEQ